MNQNGDVPVLIPAKRFAVWSRLYNRFLLEPSPAVGSNAYVAPVIQPITDADRLLQSPELRAFTVSITSAIGFLMATVPAGERWTVLYLRMRLSGGTWTHNELLVADPAGLNMQVVTYASTSTSQLYDPQTPFTLDAGWALRVNIDTHSVAGNGVLQVFILVEQAF